MLLEEASAAGETVRREGRRIKTLYIGGGTPTTLEAGQLARLLEGLRQAFDLSACREFTVEAGRPDTITREKLEVLASAGVSRVSVNPQTMEDAVLKAIGRRHTAGEILTAYQLVRQAGIPVVNMDLIAGLPQDSPEGFRRSLDAVLKLGPENITVHTLALKKGARLLEEGSGLPEGPAVAQMLDYAWQTLARAGYRPYYLYRQKFMSGSFENVGWSLPGYESLYNICMMEELHTVLSLGAGGVTKLVEPETGRIVRRSNPKFPQEYIRDRARICLEKEQILTF
ncbi:Oxygen-independent coproporphyrinogen-III oxidase-like protein HemZ [bioreactor metagenome]|uniref:Oxygen-independent coproporphyrinogen-III oxidase-like protein HemZ n=1 Tax=bioreactor metagenome TaxID=1076179 RepID=A0A645C3U4_9ZZZZ